MLLYDLTMKDIELIIEAFEDAIEKDKDLIQELASKNKNSLVANVTEKLKLKELCLKAFKDILAEQYIKSKDEFDRGFFKTFLRNRQNELKENLIRMQYKKDERFVVNEIVKDLRIDLPKDVDLTIENNAQI